MQDDKTFCYCCCCFAARVSRLYPLSNFVNISFRFSQKNKYRFSSFFSFKSSYLSLWHDWHLHPVDLSVDDLLIQMQHFLHTPKWQSMHSSLLLKRRENPSSQRAQILWLSDCCFTKRLLTCFSFSAEAKSISTCLKKKGLLYKPLKKFPVLTLVPETYWMNGKKKKWSKMPIDQLVLLWNKKVG